MVRKLLAVVVTISVLEQIQYSTSKLSMEPKEDNMSHDSRHTDAIDTCLREEQSSTDHLNGITEREDGICKANDNEIHHVSECSYSSSDMDLVDGESKETVNRMSECAREIENNLSEIRWTDYSVHGSRLIKEGRYETESKSSMFSILSYNVLSQKLLEDHMYLYRKHDSHALKWPGRSQRLLREFKQFDADIICLQELEYNHLDSFYNKHLNRMGYEGVYKKRTNEKVDGCAIYYKKDKFKLVEANKVEFYKPNIRLLDRDNVGVVVKLAFRGDNDKQFVVGTTHLLYNPRRSDIKLAQTQVLLAEIEKMAYVRYNDLTERPEYLPVILTGDMNYSPDSAVYDFVTRSSLRYEGRSSKSLEHVDDGFTLNKTLVPSELGITDNCQFATSVMSRDGKFSVNYGSGKLRHFLNLETVYDHVKNELPEATTSHKEWLTVDYIFYSQDCNREDTLRHDGKLKVVSRLSLPNIMEAENLIRYLPNLGCGSDHLPLLATFQLTGD